MKTAVKSVCFVVNKSKKMSRLTSSVPEDDVTFAELRQRLLYDEEQLERGTLSEPNRTNFLSEKHHVMGKRDISKHDSMPTGLDENDEANYSDQNTRAEVAFGSLHFSKSPLRRNLRASKHPRVPRSGKRVFHEDTTVGPADGVFVAICIGEALDLQRIHLDWGPVMLPSKSIQFSSPRNLRARTVTPTCVVSLDSEVTLLRMFGERDVFLFRFGCIVAWGLPERCLDEIKTFLNPYVLMPLADSQIEQDDMFYCSGTNSSIRKDRVVLATANALERMAHAYALAQSVKLTVFETSVDATILKTKSIPEEMARSGRLPKSMNSLAVSKQMGELFVQRCHVNLHTDILDTPEIFWEFDEYEEQYEKCRRYLDISKRVEILNHRLEIVKDLYEMLQNEVQVEHGNYLEWIVIILILLEVVVELFRLFVDYYLKS